MQNWRFKMAFLKAAAEYQAALADPKKAKEPLTVLMHRLAVAAMPVAHLVRGEVMEPAVLNRPVRG